MEGGWIGGWMEGWVHRDGWMVVGGGMDGIDSMETVHMSLITIQEKHFTSFLSKDMTVHIFLKNQIRCYETWFPSVDFHPQ